MISKLTKIITIVMFFAVSSYAETITLRLGSGHPTGALEYTKTAHEWFAPELKKELRAKLNTR